jgi:DNA-directed RNA polymerase subunit beta
MQRQAVPLLKATAPFIGTGVEARAARDAGDLVLARGDGKVIDVDGSSITVEYSTGQQSAHRNRRRE